MQFILASAAKKDAKYLPRHFLKQAEYLAPEAYTMTDTLAEVTPGEWALLIRAPGAFSLSRESLNERSQAATPTVFEKLDQIELVALRNKRGALIIDLGWEVLFTYDDVIDGLIREIKALDLDPRKVFVIHCNFAAGPVVEAKWKARTSLPVVRTIEFPVTLALMNAWQQSQVKIEAIEGRLALARTALAMPTRSKRFCFFNGEPRPHRLMILCGLAAADVLDEGYVSMLGYFKSQTANKVKLRQELSEAARYRAFAARFGVDGKLVETIEDVLARLPMVLDLDAGDMARSLEQVAWSSPDPKFYDQSWFGVVADTLFFDADVMFVSEKILKPIINAAPFFYFGTPGASTHMSEWGFQPHGGIFSATSDTVDNGRVRMEGVLEQVAGACRLPEEDLRDAVIAEWPVVAENYRHFWWRYRDRLRTAFLANVVNAVAQATSERA